MLFHYFKHYMHFLTIFVDFAKQIPLTYEQDRPGHASHRAVRAPVGSGVGPLFSDGEMRRGRIESR